MHKALINIIVFQQEMADKKKHVAVGLIYAALFLKHVN